jgi:hypothetical protein
VINPPNIANAFRQCLEVADLEGVRALWGEVAPHLPQPKSDFEVQVMMHRARTEVAGIPRSKRYYSHCWLIANGLASGLPEHEKPKAERRDFKFAYGVGIVVKTNSPDPMRQQAAKLVERAMSDAVEDAVANGGHATDRALMQSRMDHARIRTVKQLFGR